MAFNLLSHHAQSTGMNFNLRESVQQDGHHVCQIQCGSIVKEAAHPKKATARDVAAESILKLLAAADYSYNVNTPGGPMYSPSISVVDQQQQQQQYLLQQQQQQHGLQQQTQHQFYNASSPPSMQLQNYAAASSKAVGDQSYYSLNRTTTGDLPSSGGYQPYAPAAMQRSNNKYPAYASAANNSSSSYSDVNRRHYTKPDRPKILQQTPKPTKPQLSVPNPIGMLQELSQKLTADAPEYNEVGHRQESDMQHVYTVECKFIKQAKLGSARTKQSARAVAADQMLNHIACNPTVLEPFKKPEKAKPADRSVMRNTRAAEKQQQQKSSSKKNDDQTMVSVNGNDTSDGAAGAGGDATAAVAPFPGLDDANPISSLQELVTKCGWPSPQYSIKSECDISEVIDGNAAAGTPAVLADVMNISNTSDALNKSSSVGTPQKWKCTVAVGDEHHAAAVATSKREAKECAARELYEVLMRDNKLEKAWLERMQRRSQRQYEGRKLNEHWKKHYLRIANLQLAETESVVALRNLVDAATVDNPKEFLQQFAVENAVYINSMELTEAANPKIKGFMKVLVANTKPNVIAAGVGSNALEALADAESMMVKLLAQAMQQPPPPPPPSSQKTQAPLPLPTQQQEKQIKSEDG